MTNTQIKQFIQQSKYKTEYLPLYENKKNKLFAYEALSRFVFKDKTISSSDFFKKLHKKDEISFILEKKNKKIQIKKCKKDKKLILHFDSNVFSKKEFRIFWKDLLSKNKEQVIVEITQNCSLSNIDAKSYLNLMIWLKKNKIDFILSDFAKEGNIFSYENVALSSFVKIDKKLFIKAMREKPYLYILDSFLVFCKTYKTKTILCEINTKEEYEFAQKLSVNYIQGEYLKEV